MNVATRWRWRLTALCWWLYAGAALAAQPDSGYLAYREPQTAGPSVLSTTAYIITVLLTIGLVVALAYFTSRLLGEKFARRGASGPVRILASLTLGPNRGIFVVDIAGKVLVVGAAEHSVNLLQEITDPTACDALRAEGTPAAAGDFSAVLQRQITALRQASQRLSSPLRRAGSDGEKNRQEKR